jgi:N6-adenosine-specific RNA methylase IME4/ParB-like chromosome segregation protein Spo0J
MQQTDTTAPPRPVKSPAKPLPYHPLAELFPILEGEDFAALVADVKAHGLRSAIVLYENKILDGRNRYRACIEAGVEPRFVTFKGADPLAYVLSKNLHRRHLTESQRAMIAARLADMKQGERTDLEPSANLPKVDQASAAEKLNVSTRSVGSAAKVLRTGTKVVADAVASGRVPVSVAAKIADLPSVVQDKIIADPRPDIAIKKAVRAKKEQALGAKQVALPTKKYGVIVADPKWRFEPYSRETGMDRAADNHFCTSPLEVIRSRDVASIAAPDCVLFLWATAPMLPQALEVMAAWGFEYRTNLVWSKDKAGTGYWYRNRHELLLVGVRGNIPAPAMGEQWDSVIEAQVSEHSAKPEIFLKMIEGYFPTLPKIELNRRGPAREGWDAWGAKTQP